MKSFQQQAKEVAGLRKKAEMDKKAEQDAVSGTGTGQSAIVVNLSCLRWSYQNDVNNITRSKRHSEKSAGRRAIGTKCAAKSTRSRRRHRYTFEFTTACAADVQKYETCDSFSI